MLVMCLAQEFAKCMIASVIRLFGVVHIFHNQYLYV